MITRYWTLADRSKRPAMPSRDFCRDCNAEQPQNIFSATQYVTALANVRRTILEHLEVSKKKCLTKGDLRKHHIFIILEILISCYN